MFGPTLVEPKAPEPTLEERYLAATQKVANHVRLIEQRRLEFANPTELAFLEREHWANLQQWAGLKRQMDEEQACPR